MTPRVRIEGLSVAYGGRAALTGVDLELAKVERPALGDRSGQLGVRLACAVVFGTVIALVTGWPTWVVTVIVAALAVGSALLLPSIILGYAVKAAEREDRERGL